MKIPIIVFVVLLLCSGTVTVWAQNQQAEETEEETQTEQQVLDTDLTPEELAAAENNELILEDSEAEEEQAPTNSRFIPTEEISQDLGVSFPVDI